jgi:carboxy-cis,cis-muconate cyclase
VDSWEARRPDVNMSGNRLLAVLLLGGRCAADYHHLFTSSFSTPHLYSLQFDDQKNTIVDIANITAHDGHPWISFSYDKGSLYAGETDGFASYVVENSTSLVYSSSVKVGFECGGKKDGFGAPYVLASLRAPFTVFGATSSGCGAAMSVEPDGKLQSLIQAYKYKEGSTIKGLAVDPESKYLYSADEQGNSIWIHLINDKGTVNQVGSVLVPFPNSGPRHLIVHPDGHYLYVVLARSNLVAVFAINSGTGSDIKRLTFTGLTYSLIPPGKSLEPILSQHSDHIRYPVP